MTDVDDGPDPFEDDIEEFEKNQLANDNEGGEMFDDDDYDGPGMDDDDDRSMFADPGGESALRAATKDNPRNLPCPNCREPNRLTPADRARGYQCDSCARRAEHGGY